MNLTPDYRRRRAAARFDHHARQLERFIACNAAREHLDTTLELLELLVGQMAPVTLETDAYRHRLAALRFAVEAIAPPSWKPTPASRPSLRLVTP
jgi:hypothetical protein